MWEKRNKNNNCILIHNNDIIICREKIYSLIPCEENCNDIVCYTLSALLV